eukprot:TRINITY_DN15058_c0_g1_i1.p1 TRINITY_DN15058_c0_g1~~TRINITY_DN15058_c0_g1_i1.p1  ORF type:complete len:385 (+),score=115.54 TRINITY_DN15058_c0_g1_i1:118-1272(+)
MEENKVLLEEIATVHRGTIEGANFCVGVPKEGDTSCLLIHCHGFRPEGMHAELDDTFWLRLIQQGWTVAITSYRRPGLIVADAIRDVLNLRNWVCCEVGIPAWCFLDGRSMGGAISTRIAEKLNSKRLFNGVLAIGAALLVKEEGCELSYKPTIPILYLTNTSEHGPINNYINQVSKNAEKAHRSNEKGGDEIITPALHAVHREGHNWTNARERWRAFSSLVEWAFVGSLVTEFQFDGTKPALFNPGSKAVKIVMPDGSPALECTVFLVEDETCFHLNVTLADLDEIKVRINHVVDILLPEQNDKRSTIHVGAYPFVGIPDTSTVLGESPEDFMCLFSLSEFRNKPAESVLALGLKLGSKILLIGKKDQPRTFKRKPMPAPIDL